MEEKEETLEYDPGEYCPEEKDKCIEELSGKKVQAVIVSSLAEENSEIMPGLGASQSNSAGAIGKFL